MFCLSCYYTSASPIVQCVDSILKHHPNETVVIVDSYSPDKSYFDSFKDNENVVILDDVNDDETKRIPNSWRIPNPSRQLFRALENRRRYDG